METDYKIYSENIKNINHDFYGKYKFHSRGILTKFYESNKLKFSCIVSKEYMYEKGQKVSVFKKSSVWENRNFNTRDKWYYDGTILFGLESGIYFEIDFMDDFSINEMIDISVKEKNYNTLPKIHCLYNGDQKFTFDFIEFISGNQSSIITDSKIDFDSDGIKIHGKTYLGGRSTISNNTIKLGDDEIFILNDLLKFWSSEFIRFYEEKEIEENKIKLQFEKDEEIRKQNLKNKKDELISQLDKDENGFVDLIDSETFTKLLNKNQKSIVDIDKTYIQKFVKVSMYLKTKKSNTQKIFESIRDTKNDKELNELVNLLKNQIHTYELLVFHSINMVTSLVDSDLITFYEIYECFDQLGVFNSNWENEVSNKLNDIGSGIRDLMYSIYQMENKIVNSIDNLSYTTQESFRDLTFSVEKQLSSIDSTIKFNNLLTGIQTYQMYRINQNTKRIG